MTAVREDVPENGWRETHLGRLMGEALRRFDARVLVLMARNVEVPLALSNLAARERSARPMCTSPATCRPRAHGSPSWRPARA